jgi:hypothetical protein
MVTDFKIRADWYQTPFGMYENRGEANDRVSSCDMLPELTVTHVVEMAKIGDLVKALNSFCGHLAEEYNFTVSAYVKYEDKNATVPENFLQLIAYAVEGGSEGFYVHIGAILRGHEDATNPYQDFGFCKTYSSESAYAICKDAQRFLNATLWN